MPRIFASLSTAMIALWLGSLFHTLLSVASLFRAFPKTDSRIAVEAAPIVFYATERALLLIGAIAILATLLWRRVVSSRQLTGIVVLLVIAGMLAITQTTIISRKMDALRVEGQGAGETFKRLHGVSSTQYLAQTLCLLSATLLLPFASNPAKPLPPG